jgi:hypothetical protein
MTNHTLTNGTYNWIFQIDGDKATVTLEDNYETETRTVTVNEAREDYKMIKKFNRNVRPGYTPLAQFRKIATITEYQAWAEKEFDFINNDNDAEREMVWREEFNDCGFITVAV